MNDTYKRWDICIANVPFEDIAQSKPRPVLILNTGAAIHIQCLKMTGQPPRRGEYVLKKWREAGLHKKTTVRIGKLLLIDIDQVFKKIGHLDKVDILNIEKLL